MTTSLVIGKFAPLHRGHGHLLETAARAADALTVVVYDAPDITRVPVAVRAGWVSSVVPAAAVLEGNSPPPRGIWNEHTMRAHEEFIKNLVRAHAVTHVFSGEPYGERLAAALGAEHIYVEKVFKDIRLSASLLRQTPALLRRYVQANVYADIKKYDDVV